MCVPENYVSIKIKKKAFYLKKGAMGMKIMRRGLAMLLCILIVIPTSGMTWAEDTAITEKETHEHGEADGQEVNLLSTISLAAEVPGTEGTVTLNAGNGSLNGNNTVTLVDGKLPDLPVPNRSGWTFKGWYTGKVTENFYGDAPDEVEAAITSTYSSQVLRSSWDMKCEAFQEKGYPTNYLDSDYKCLMFSWIIYSDGVQVSSGSEVEAGTTLYAMYAPKAVKVEFCLNGWKNSHAVALTTYTQYGAYFTSLELDKHSEYQWTGRTFDGWYSASTGGTKYEFDGQGGNLSYCGTPLTGDLKLYARWSGGKNATSLSFSRNSYSLEPGEKLTVTANYAPADADIPKLNWKSSNQNLVWLESVSEDGRTATFGTKNAGTENQYVVITATAAHDSKVTSSVNLTLCHTWDNGRVTKWPSCEAGGTTIYTCKNCKAERTVNYSADGHRYGSRKVAATCTSEGYEEIYCTVCKKVESRTTIPAIGHNWRTTTVSGCTGTVTTKTCTICGVVEVSSDPGAAVHVWETTPTVDKKPTCNTEGSQSFHCRNCNLTKDSSIIPANPKLHTWGEWVETKAATEKENGEEQHTCTTCGAVETRTVIYISQEDIDNPNINPEINNNLEHDSIVDKTAAGNALRDTLQNIINSFRTSKSAEEKTLAENVWAATVAGHSVIVEPIIDKMGSEPENAKQFKAKLGDDALTFLNIEVVVKEEGEKVLGYLTELNDVLTLSYTLPEGVKNNRIVQVLREHDGLIEVLESWVEDGKVYFVTDKFSTYAIGSTNDIAYATVTVADQVYTGSEIKPEVRVKINGSEILTEGKDYTVSCMNNVEIGEATVIITGMGDFEGSTHVTTFNIKEEETSSGTTDSPSNTNDGQTTVKRSPKTGNDADTILWISVLVLINCGFFAVLARKRMTER